MIYQKYLLREYIKVACWSLLVILLILSVLYLSRYLSKVFSQGISQVEALYLFNYQMARILPRALGIAVFISIFLVLHRLYKTSEMIILEFAGVNTKNILVTVFYFVGPVTLAMFFLTVYLNPWLSQNHVERMDRLHTLVQVPEGKEYLMYSNHEDLFFSKIDNSYLYDIIFAQQDEFLSAPNGVLEFPYSNTFKAFNGYYWILIPEGGWKIGFERLQYGIFEQLGHKKQSTNHTIEIQNTLDLWKLDAPQGRAELFTRINTPILFFCLFFIAPSLARVGQRMERSLQLLMGVFWLIAMLNFLKIVESLIQQEKISFLTAHFILYAGVFMVISLISYKRSRV